MKFAFMAAEKASFPVRFMCRELGVSVSGFYASPGRPEAPRKAQDRVLTEAVRAVHLASRRTYGSPRVQADLKARGHHVGRKRVARLMREAALRGIHKRRFVRTTDSKHTSPVAANVLNRNFTADRPNVSWVTDITYIPTREGWLYLATMLDLFSRRVVRWAMQDNMDTSLVVRALKMALAQRRPPAHLTHHSDRGSQYASTDYRAILENHGITCSMSRKGNCWDNAVAESFFATLKKELVHHVNFNTRLQAQHQIFEWIEVFYNRQRRHSTLAYMSPVDYL